MDLSSTKPLNNGVAIPLLGFGVWQAEDTVKAVTWALEAGYRHIDAAAIYKNEDAVGKAIRESGIPRKDIFLTTKLWNSAMRAGKHMEAFEKSLGLLQLDYVDLYLVHWPVENVFLDAWKVLEEIYASGRA